MNLFKYFLLLMFTTSFLYSLTTPKVDTLENTKLLIVQDITIKNLESKIIDLKSEIEKLKDTQSSYSVDKSQFDSKMNENRILVQSQDKRINDINFYLIAWGVLITLILVVVIWKSRRESIEASKEAVETWVEENAETKLNSKIDNVLKTKDDKIDSLVKEQVDSKIMPIYSKTKAMLKDIEVIKKKAITHEDNILKISNKMLKSISEKDLKAIEEKEESKLTLEDYYQLGVKSYRKQNFNTALNNFENAIKMKKDNSIDLLNALFAKAITLGELNKSEEAIKVYDEVIAKYEDNKENSIQEQVARVIVNKALRLRKLEKLEEAIKILDEMIIKYKDNKESVIQEQVVNAIVNKTAILGELEKLEEAIKILDETIIKYKDNKESSIQLSLIDAIVNRAVILGRLDKSEEATKILDEIIIKYKDNKESSIQLRVVNALANKIEHELISNNNITSETKKLIEDFNFQKYKISLDILLILSEAIKKPQDKEIELWQEKYRDKVFERFSFYELDEWSSTIKDKEVKSRIVKYIDIFKSHGKS